jgi:hypothetical protein
MNQDLLLETLNGPNGISDQSRRYERIVIGPQHCPPRGAALRAATLQ